MKSFLLVPLAALLMSCSNVPVCQSKMAPQPRCHPVRQHVWHPDAKSELPYIVEMPKAGVKAKAVVVLVVGQDGTLCDYKSLTRALVKHGYAVYGSEHRTMKYDSVESRRGKAVPWHQWVEDLQNFTLKVVRKEQPKLPIYYHAHSFGAVVAMESVAECGKNAAKKDIVPKGLILQSPAYAMLPERSVALVAALASPLSWVRIKQLTFLEQHGMAMTTDPDWNCAWLKSEDRVGEGYRIGWFLEALKMGRKARLASENEHLPPVLALEGRKDFVTLGGEPGTLLAKKQADYEAYLKNQHKTKQWDVRSYPGAHLLTEGPGKTEVIRDIVGWLDAQP
jgi:alpha-beta hydrolase superfamily lysophospholipase